MQSLYHTSPARTPVAGSVESIRKITAQTLYDCHKAFYTPANMCLVVVGDVEPQQVLDIARRVLPKDSGELIERDYGAEEPTEAARAYAEERMEVSMPSFLVGFKCPPQHGERSSTGSPPSASWPATCLWASPARCTPGCTARG